VAAVNELKMEYGQAPLERSILNSKLRAIKEQFAFTELEAKGKQGEIDIYGAMSPGTLIAYIYTGIVFDEGTEENFAQ
jgi:hypothetical protein